MSDQEEDSLSLSSTVTAINASGNVTAGRDLTVHLTTNVEATRKILTTFKLFDPPTRNFTGRKKMLETIHNQMLKCSLKKNCLERIVVLSGLGGIGKSELARMYAKTYIKDPIIQNVGWIDAENETGMKASFVSIANKFEIHTKYKELKEIVEIVYDHFSNYVQNGLFIFDNSNQMNDMPFGIYEYLPIQESLKQRPLVLLTSRDQDWDILKENVINVNELSLQDSIELLEQKFCLTVDNPNYNDYKKLVTKLADALQGYPLGLALATSNIISNENWTDLKVEVEAYLERMGEPCGDWIEDDQHRAATRYKLIMDNVWEVTLEKIRASKATGENAIKLLNIVAYLPPDQIRKKQIEEIFYKMYSTALQSKVFYLLERYSLIKIETREEYFNEETHFIRIHRLVQLTTRSKLDREKDMSYLLRLCEYVGYASYNKAFLYRDTTRGLHGFLKTENWLQKNSIHFSLIFCSILTTSPNVEDALSLAQDIYTFLDMRKPEQARILHGDNVTNLFFLCMFWINQKQIQTEISPTFLLSEKELENVFVSVIQPSTVFALTSTEDPKSLEEHSYLLCIGLLPNLYRLNKELTKPVIPRIVSTLNETRCCSIKYISKVYATLWKICKFNTFESFQLLRPVFEKHFEIYASLDQDSRNQVWSYWDDDPLDLLFIIQQLEDEDNREFKKRKMGGFKANNGCVT